jgi:ABC-type ATPase involved in cell division
VAGDLADHRELVASLLRRFGLEDLRTGLPRDLTRRATAHRPRARPRDATAGADRRRTNRHQDAAWVSKIFATLQEAASLGTCCIVATHDPTLERFADRTLSMADGRIVTTSVGS